MIQVNGHVYERVDYCKILPSGTPQICKYKNATNLITETGDLYPLDTIYESITADNVADMQNALAILGVTE